MVVDFEGRTTVASDRQAYRVTQRSLPVASQLGQGRLLVPDCRSCDSGAAVDSSQARAWRAVIPRTRSPPRRAKLAEAAVCFFSACERSLMNRGVSRTGSSQGSLAKVG